MGLGLESGIFLKNKLEWNWAKLLWWICCCICASGCWNFFEMFLQNKIVSRIVRHCFILSFECHYITDPPDLNDTKEVFVEETSDVVLSCDVRANPPVTVAWKKDGEVLDLTSGSYKTTNNGITAQLSITKAKHDVHQGTYICEVNSSVYGIMGRTFNVMVEGLWSCFILIWTLTFCTLFYFYNLCSIMFHFWKVYLIFFSLR